VVDVYRAGVAVRVAGLNVTGLDLGILFWILNVQKLVDSKLYCVIIVK